MATLPPRNLRHAWLRFEGQVYTDAYIQDFEERFGRIFDRQILRVVFTNYAWRKLFGIRGLLVRELILEFFNMCRFGDSVLDLDDAGTLQFQLAYWVESSIEITSKADLSDYWTRISSAGDFLRIALSYTLIREPLRRLCHRIVDEGTSVNVLYLLAYYLFRHAFGRKQGARMSGGHFITRLGVHFRVITEESLRTLIVELRGLTTIDIDELVRLRIRERLGDVVTWVAMGQDGQQVGGAARAAQIDLDGPKGSAEHQEGV
ncbi:hypothetical protein Tco_1140288 [Tanacetum coccineum]